MKEQEKINPKLWQILAGRVFSQPDPVQDELKAVEAVLKTLDERQLVERLQMLQQNAWSIVRSFDFEKPGRKMVTEDLEIQKARERTKRILKIIWTNDLKEMKDLLFEHIQNLYELGITSILVVIDGKDKRVRLIGLEGAIKAARSIEQLQKLFIETFLSKE